MSSILPYTNESRAQIRRHLKVPSGTSELTKVELSEIYELLTDERPDASWSRPRLREKVLKALSEHVDTDLSRRNGHHHTHFRQGEAWHLARAVRELAGDDGGGLDG